MTTESGADSEAKPPQDNKETEKGKSKAAEPVSPQNQPEPLPAAAGHSTPARKEQVSLQNQNQPTVFDSLISINIFYLFNMFQYVITFHKYVIGFSCLFFFKFFS